MLARLFLFLLFIPLASHAEYQGIPPVEIARDPSSMVHDCVNVITGSYCEFACPLQLAGPSSLQFRHAYCSLDTSQGDAAGGWSLGGAVLAYMYAPQARSNQQASWHLSVTESDGMCCDLLGDRNTTWKAENEMKDKPKRIKGPTCDIRFSFSSPDALRGVTNTSSGLIAGATNYRNHRWIYHHKGRYCEKIRADGTISHYRHLWEEQNHFCNYIRDHEVYPNGSKLFYHTDFSREHPERGASLFKIVAKDSGGKQQLGHIDIPKDRKRNGRVDFTVSMSDGRWVRYYCAHFTCKSVPRVVDIISSHSPPIHYRYTQHSKKDIAKGLKHEQIERKELPDHRYLAISYYTVGRNDVGGVRVHVDKHDKSRHKHVRSLSAPVGHDAAPHVIYSFQYHFPRGNGPQPHHGVTQVRNALGHRKDYGWSAQKRLEAVYHYTGSQNYALHSVDRLHWGKGAHETNLVYRTLEGADGAIRSCVHYQYDAHHNPIRETIYGNLTGEDESTLTIEAGTPRANGSESLTVQRSYSEDRFHNLLKETHPSGKTLTYKYKPETNLCTVLLVHDKGKIVRRTFRSYDSFGAVTQLIEDDGCQPSPSNLEGATHRIITRMKNRQTAPCMGLAEEVTRHAVELKSNKETLLERVVYRYTKVGQVKREEHYDSANKLCYTLERDYDHLGNIVREKDAEGFVTRYRYDANGNKIWEQGPDERFHLEFRYDYVNRLIAEEIVLSNGTRYTKTFRYDHMGNKLADVNLRGHETHYEYDEFQHCLASTSPEAFNLDGEGLQAIQTSRYDVAGHRCSHIDALGNETKSRHTIRGQLTETLYPDGRVESKRYHLHGTLAKETRSNGTYTLFHYDGLDRLVRSEVFSGEGELLCVETKKYQGLNLLAETDANGFTTHYEYDLAARCTAVVTDHHRQEIRYDPLGRPWQKIDWIDTETARITTTEHDKLGRVVEERVEDLEGEVHRRVLYTYDHRGNCTEVSTFDEQGIATTKTDYDALGRVIRVTDAEGHSTVTTYEDWFINAFGQKVLCITETDPLGNQTVTEHNAWDLPVSITKKDPYGNGVAFHTLSYDLEGRVVERVETVKATKKEEREVRTQWQYDESGRCIELIEAAGTQEERITHFVYNSCGEKVATVYNDGTVIESLYDAQGRLEHYSTSDGSIDYRYTYDTCGNVMEVLDIVNDSATVRSYDSAHRMTTETLGHGWTVAYSYDSLDRCTRITHADGSAISYEYDASHLKTVTRLDKEGNTSYTHRYLAFDPSGNCLSQELAGQAGLMQFTYDRLSRIAAIQHDAFHEVIPSGGYDAAGNLVREQRTDNQGTLDCQYAYDALHQLIREQGVQEHSYVYDSLQNRLQIDDEECEVNSLNELLQQGAVHFHYDPRGNRVGSTGEQETCYEYDPLGRLTAVERGTQRWEYAYDAFNRRLSRRHFKDERFQAETRFLYQDQNEVGAIDTDGSILQFRVIGSGYGAEIAASILIESDSCNYAPIHDHCGNIVALIDPESGLVQQTYRYSAFGQEESYFECQESQNPWRYSSKRVDPETGFLSFGRRFYDPTTGRWVSPDPKGLEEGPNLYTYVNNRPLVLRDLYGLEATEQNYYRLLTGDGCHQRAGYIAQKGAELVDYLRHENFLVACGLVDRKSCHEEHCHNGVLAGWVHPHLIVNWNPGQDTTPQDCYDVVGWLQQEFDGMQIGYHYNSTYGTVFDTCESVLSKMDTILRKIGIPNKGIRLKVEAMRADIAAVGGVGSGARILEICHSQGALQVQMALEYLTPDERAMYDIITIGGAGLTDAPELGFRQHNVHRQDVVPRVVCCIACSDAERGYRKDIVFYGENGPLGVATHGVWTPHYQVALNKSLENYEKHYPQIFNWK